MLWSSWPAYRQQGILLEVISIWCFGDWALMPIELGSLGLLNSLIWALPLDNEKGI